MKAARFLIYLLPALIPCYETGAQLRFTNVTDSAGINHYFEVYEGMFGGGAAVLDVNNDGFEDIYLTGGMRDDALYLNDGTGSFTDIYQSSGLTITRQFVTQGVTSADVNKDGFADLMITTINRKDSARSIPRAENLLFINNGDATFRDSSEEFRIVRLNSFSTGASFGDINGDGLPDLFIGNYFLAYEGSLSVINDATIVNSSQTSEPYLLLNQGGRYFSNVFHDYGLKFKGFGFGGVITDYDNDGDLDIYANNDFGYKATPNILLQNRFPEETFADVSDASGMDLPINAMGTAIGDYDNDGDLDYYITNIRFNRFMVNNGDGTFMDLAKKVGMDFVSISWGANFADFDNDTDLDLFVANGDLNPNVVPMADFLFENNDNTFNEVAPQAGVNDYGIGRGSVVFDFDNDGDLDILVVNQKAVKDYPVSSTTRLYRNDTPTGHWFKVKLRGRASDTEGIGSRIEVVLGSTRLIREIDGGSSHLSRNSSIAHFGVGQALQVDSVIVKWLNGDKQVFTNQPVNTMLDVIETRVPIERKLSVPVVAVSILLAGALSFFAAGKLRWPGNKFRTR